MDQMVKNLPAMQETLVRSLGWDDPLDESPTLAGGFFTTSATWEASATMDARGIDNSQEECQTVEKRS